MKIRPSRFFPIKDITSTYRTKFAQTDLAISCLFAQLGPEPAFSRLGLGGSSGGYSSHGYTSHASLRVFGTQLGGDKLFFRRLTKGDLPSSKPGRRKCQGGTSLVQKRDEGSAWCKPGRNAGPRQACRCLDCSCLTGFE